MAIEMEKDPVRTRTDITEVMKVETFSCGVERCTETGRSEQQSKAQGAVTKKRSIRQLDRRWEMASQRIVDNGEEEE